MAYCRWSDCDVYVYESEQGWETHVAGQRIFNGPINLMYAGESFVDATPGECADRLALLKGIGFDVPEDVIDELRYKQDEKNIVIKGAGL